MSNTRPVAVITGTTHGIGVPTAREIARAGYRTLLACRNMEAGRTVAQQISAQTGNIDVGVIKLDLSDLDSVRQAASEIGNQCAQLDLLVNNAGIANASAQTSKQGHELTFATNHLGPFLLTRLLLDRLRAAPSARIVVVASAAHRGGHIDIDDLNFHKRGYKIMRVYGSSKLANMMMTSSLALRLAGSAVTANSLHPGFVATNIAGRNGWLGRVIGSLIAFAALDVERGARTSIHLALSKDVESVTGKYFDEHQRIATPTDEALDEALQEKLWDASSRLVGLPA